MRLPRCVPILLSLLAMVLVAGCATPPGDDTLSSRAQVTALSDAIGVMGTGVDPAEAARAAEIAYVYTGQLAQEYQITDPPLVHNMKVNRGLRPRGLCWHWAEDLEARLAQEQFQTLSLHRAIANADNPLRIDHSTVIISRRGDTMFDGIVLDPWRKGGVLHWTPTDQDARYAWVPRREVFARKLKEMEQGR